MFGINNQGSLFEINIFTHVVPNLDFVTVHEYKRRNFTFLSLPHKGNNSHSYSFEAICIALWHRQMTI